MRRFWVFRRVMIDYLAMVWYDNTVRISSDNKVTGKEGVTTAAPDERTLVERAQAGDLDAFEQIVQTYQTKVYNIALSMTGNHHDADDAAQDVFIKVYRSIGAFSFRARFSTWLYRVATNVCLDYLRKRKRTAAVTLDADDTEDAQIQIADPAPTPEILLEEKETIRQVRQAIAQLSDEHKKVILLRDLSGLSYDEIAAIEQCSVGTVKSRINRARQNLKKLLEENREQF